MNDYVLKIWTRQDPGEVVPPRLADHELSVFQPRAVTMEEIPADVLLSVPALAFVTELHLTPNPPTALVRGYLMKFAARLAKENEGVIENLQPDVVAGEPRLTVQTDGYVFPPLNEYTPLLRLNVWSAPERGFDTVARGVLSAIERCLPQAMPTAYGSTLDAELGFEANGGREFFLDFLTREPAPVWCAHEPVTHVYVADAARRTAALPGYRANCLTVELPDAMYDYPEWSLALRRLLRELSAVCGAFFAQIVRGECGVVSWWWRGIPIELGTACVIGEPYYSLIPDCAAKGQPVEDAENTAYFEEPNGPFVDASLLSVKKKRLFQRKNKLVCPEDYTLAERLPTVTK